MHRFKNFIENVNKASFSQNPKRKLIENGFQDFLYLIDNDITLTKKNIFLLLYDPPKCPICNTIIDRLLPGWRGWNKTCSEKCENMSHSIRQQGEKNSCHKMSKDTKESMKIKLSSIMKDKIEKGEFTPKSENYKLYGMISFYHGEEIRKVRSLWELIYWLKNPNFEYEKIRIRYYDWFIGRERIYITDFFDKSTNTIYEIKPKKYISTLIYKQKAVIENGFNYHILDESFFNKCKTEEMIDLINSVVLDKDIDKIKSRLKWLKKV